MLQKRSKLIRIFFIRLWKGRHNTTDIRLLKSTVAIMKTCIYYIFYQGMITIPFIHPQTHTTKRHTLSPYLKPYRIYVRNTYGNIRQRSLASMHIVIGAIKKRRLERVFGEKRGQPSRQKSTLRRSHGIYPSTRVTSNASRKRDRVDSAKGLLMAECHEKRDNKASCVLATKASMHFSRYPGCTNADAPRLLDALCTSFQLRVDYGYANARKIR